MWVKTKSGDYINLDKVNSITINPYNAVVCKFDNSTMTLGNFSSRWEAEDVLGGIFVNCKKVE